MQHMVIDEVSREEAELTRYLNNEVFAGRRADTVFTVLTILLFIGLTAEAGDDGAVFDEAADDLAKSLRACRRTKDFMSMQ